MKRLLLFILFSGSLDSFSQMPDTIQPLRQFDTTRWDSPLTSPSIDYGLVQIGSVKWNQPIKPDTLRATLIVYYDRGPAILHTKPGFVVRGEREVYLDDRKRVIKSPLEVFSYMLKK